MAWGDEDYARVTQLLLPVRYEIFAIGRSNAQVNILSKVNYFHNPLSQNYI